MQKTETDKETEKKNCEKHCPKYYDFPETKFTSN